MKKKETRSKRITSRVEESLYNKFTKFCNQKKWTQSTAIEEAVIRLIEK